MAGAAIVDAILAAGHENAKRFTWDACARQTLAAMHYAREGHTTA